MPLVSILMPCRNAASTLETALASIRAQTFQDYELLAVDDGSRDETPRLLRRWARRDGRIVPIRTPPRGIVSALQTAIGAARGAVLARMDADDVALPRRLELQVAYLRARPDVAACGTGVRYVPRGALRDGARRYERWVNAAVLPAEIERELFVECPIPHPTLLLRREALEAVGGYRDVSWPEDYDLVLRLWVAGHRLGKVADVLLEWREHGDRLSRVDPRYGADAFRRCKAWYLRHRTGDRPIVVWGAGPVGKAFARAAQDRGHAIAAFVELDPRKVGQEIHGAAVVAPQDLERHRGCYVVAAVGRRGAREEIRTALTAAGWTEVEEWCAVA